MLKLYGAHASPFVRKVRVALAEKGLAYEHDPQLPFNQPPEYYRISPLGKIPAIVDEGRPLSDSSVILAYLERKHPEPPLYPTDAYDYGRALWFEEYGDSALAQNLGTIFVQRVVGPRFLNRPTDEAAIAKAIEQDLPPLFDYVQRELGANEYLVASRFTVGDLAIASQFVNAKIAGFRVDEKRWPKLAVYVERMHSRPSFRKCLDEEAKMFGITL